MFLCVRLQNMSAEKLISSAPASGGLQDPRQAVADGGGADPGAVLLQRRRGQHGRAGGHEG